MNAKSEPKKAAESAEFDPRHSARLLIQLNEEVNTKEIDIYLKAYPIKSVLCVLMVFENL